MGFRVYISFLICFDLIYYSRRRTITVKLHYFLFFGDHPCTGTGTSFMEHLYGWKDRTGVLIIFALLFYFGLDYLLTVKGIKGECTVVNLGRYFLLKLGVSRVELYIAVSNIRIHIQNVSHHICLYHFHQVFESKFVKRTLAFTFASHRSV
jgi:hypothetical protein